MTRAQALAGCGARIRLLPEEITPQAVAEAVQRLLEEPATGEPQVASQTRSQPCRRRPRRYRHWSGWRRAEPERQPLVWCTEPVANGGGPRKVTPCARAAAMVRS